MGCYISGAQGRLTLHGDGDLGEQSLEGMDHAEDGLEQEVQFTRQAPSFPLGVAAGTLLRDGGASAGHPVLFWVTCAQDPLVSSAGL